MKKRNRYVKEAHPFHTTVRKSLGFFGGLVEVTIGGEEGAEARDEELALDRVACGDVSNGVEDVGVADGGVLKDFEELSGGEGLNDLAGILGSEFGGGFKEGDTVLIGLVLLRGGIHRGERRKKLLHRLDL
ncbi:hypothetical protein AAC387_Pa06g1210 [Persea americana]